MSKLTDKTCLDTEYYTPDRILDPIREFFGGSIDLDPATAPHNPTQAKVTFTKEEDGLYFKWWGNVYVNPPFGKDLRKWTAKIHEEASRGVRIVALLPGQRFETEYWQKDVLNNYLSAICFIRSRISFLDADGNKRQGNPYGSMLYAYNVYANEFARYVSSLGMVIFPMILKRYGEA